MKVNEFLNEVLAAAKAAGIDPAEVYYHGGDSFNVSALDGEISDYTREPSFTSYADPSLTVCGTARDSAKPPKIQPVQRLNSCYFIEDVTKRSAEIPKFRYFGMNKSGLSLPSLPPKSATHQSLAHADGFMQFPIH